MSKFPAMIRTEDNMKTLHNAMPSDLEGKRFANSDVFCWLSFTADMSIILNGIQLIVKKEAAFQRRRAQPFAVKRNNIS